MSEASQFSRLWNGSEPGWVIIQHQEDHEHLSISFGSEGASIRDIRSLRSLLSELSRKSLIEVHEAIIGVQTFDLGTHESSVARKLKRQCEEQNLVAQSEPIVKVRYSIINEQTNRYLLIEEEALLRKVVEEAVAQGLPTRHSTA